MSFFPDPHDWLAVTSGQVRLDLHSDSGALCLAYDFAGQGGFAVARRLVDWRLPRRFRLRLRLRGEGLANRFEIKLVDGTDNPLANVWWHQREVTAWPSQDVEWVLESPDFRFAWGPAGGGVPDRVMALEFAIVAGAGGAGRIWLQDLQIEDLALVQRCSLLGFNSDQGERTLDSVADWVASSPEDWLQLAWPDALDCAALVLTWMPQRQPRRFVIRGTPDGDVWETLLDAVDADAQQHFLYLGRRTLRALRVQPVVCGGETPDVETHGVEKAQLRDLTLVPPERARSLTDFLHEVAARLPPGRLPRYFSREQCYWTVIGAPTCPHQALVNEDGLIEIQRPGFSIESQLLRMDGAQASGLQTWADARHEVALAEHCWPVPCVQRHADGFALEIKAAAVQVAGRWCVLIRYRLRNDGLQPFSGQLLARVRPFQVTPPWQAYRNFGGVFPVQSLHWQDGLLRVNERHGVLSLVPPSHCLLQPWLAFDDDRLAQRIGHPSATQIRDDSGLAQAALAWPVTLAPGEAREVHLLVPFDAMDNKEWQDWQHQCGMPDAAALLDDAVQQWQTALGGLSLSGDEDVQHLARVLRTVTAHVLVNRAGPALQPGPRRYARSWIRDGATMGALLLRMGRADAVMAFADGYAPHVREDGYVPCCVDENGADPLVEHDSHGQWLYLVSEIGRFRPDAAFRQRMGPSMRRVLDYLCRLRAQRCTAEFQDGALQDRAGLLPESVSHEGYLAQPVHAYWDAVWAWRGLRGAAEFFAADADPQTAARCRQEADATARAIVASMIRVMQSRAIDFLPGSVEWADFDPAATACAVDQLDAAGWLPQDALHTSFARFLQGWRERLQDGRARQKYSAYDVRVVAALLRLGWRAEAHELLAFLLRDMRPVPWQQWPEISWPDLRSPGHLGDLPHSWIGAEAGLALLSLFVAEQEGALVLGRGIKPHWLAGGVQGRGWQTPFGELDFAVRQEGDGGLRVLLSGPVSPPAGIVLALPAVSAQSSCTIVQGERMTSGDGLLRLRAAPLDVVIHLN